MLTDREGHVQANPARVTYWRRWQKILADKGWGAPHWPVEWGGTDWTPTQRYLFALECFRAGAPRLIPLGLGMLAGAGIEAFDAAITWDVSKAIKASDNLACSSLS